MQMYRSKKIRSVDKYTFLLAINRDRCE